jgi:hypothetical protein
MRRMIVVAILASAMVASVAAGVAQAATFETNAQCLECHSTTGTLAASSFVLPSYMETFTVPGVDFATACAKCHWAGGATPGSSMPYATTSHAYSTGNCSGSGCHTAPFGDLNGVAVPHAYVATMSSWFYSASSPSIDAEALHRIHAAPRWPAAIDVAAGAAIPGSPSLKAKYTLRCGSCHAAAACSACHDGLDASHSAHTTPTVSMLVGSGTPSGDQSVGTTAVASLTCASAACHDPAAVSPGVAFENGSPSLSVSGVWTTAGSVLFSGGSAVKANSPSCSITLGASGGEFRYYGFTLPTGGTAVVRVDGAIVSTVSCYSPAQSGSREMYRGTLPSGTHTVSVSGSGIPGKGGGTYVTFDRISVNSTPYASYRPACAECHATQTEPHGYDAGEHADGEAAVVDPVFGPRTCSQCHSMDLTVAHASVGLCDACHTILPGDSVTAADMIGYGGWNHRCDACHGVAGSPIIQLRPPVHSHIGNEDIAPTTSIHGDLLGTWTNAPVSFTLSATKGLLGTDVAAIHYRIGDGPEQTYADVPVVVSDEGTTVVTYWSVDLSNDTETAKTAKVLIDLHGPSLTGAPIVPPNAAGWYASDVTVHFSATDALSGVAVVCPDVVVSGEGGALAASGSATDAAGNRGTGSLEVAIDKTPPETSSDATSAYVGTATVTLTATDGLSGVAHTYYSYDSGVTVHEGTEARTTIAGMYTLTFWSVDVAGNTEAPHSYAYRQSPEGASYLTDASCLECHARGGETYQVAESATPTFSVGAVDYATACAKCHWVGDKSSPGGSHPYTTTSHNYPTSNCTGSSCHVAPFGPLNGMAVPHSRVASMSSYFYSATSYLLDAETLHRIHASPRWPASADIVTGGPVPGRTTKALHSLRCASCHAAAACDACHSAVDAGHADHVTATDATAHGSGTPAGDQGVLTVASGITCTSARCHPASAITSSTTFENASPALTKSGTWTSIASVLYSGGSAMKSGASGASVTLALNGVPAGTEFRVYGYTLATGGSGVLRIDAATVATISCYGPQSGSVEMYRGTLAAGSHTISLVNSGVAGARGGRDVTMDAIVVIAPGYHLPDGDFRPSCATFGCHIDRTVFHGYDPAAHAGSEASATDPALSGKACGECHSMDLDTEHASGGCAVCHTMRPDLGFSAADHITAGGGWDHTCGACHDGVVAPVRHATAGAHDVSAVTSDAACTTCHPSTFPGGSALDLTVIHANAATTVAGVAHTGCDVCHWSGTPSTNECAVCHPDRLAAHGYDAATHTASASCIAGCHTPMQGLVELGPVHDATTSPIPCTGCHPTKAAEVTPWDRTCTACHPVALGHVSAAASHIGTDAAVQDASFLGNGCSDNASHTDMSNCHDISSLSAVHAKLGGAGCFVCHATAATPKRECLDCHQEGNATTYTVTGALTSGATTSYPSSDTSITSGWTYSTTPSGQARYAVVNSAYPPVNTTRYMSVTTTKSGGVLFGFARPSVPANAHIVSVKIYAKAKATSASYPRKMSGWFSVGGQTYLSSNQTGNLPYSGWLGGTGIGQAFVTSPSRLDYTRDPLYGEMVYQNPKTGADWTPDQLNASGPNSLDAVGFQLTSSVASNNVSVCQVFVRVDYYVLGDPLPWPTVGTSTYHHNNAKYLHDPSDAAGKRFAVSPAHGWYDALYYQDCYDFCHRGNGGSPVFSAAQGSWMWYSVGGDPSDTTAAVRTLTLKQITLPAGSPTLSFTTDYILGSGATGYVEISTDSSATWTPLAGTVGGNALSSVSGSSGGWVAATYDLSAYAGQSVQLRFRYVNGASAEAGWAFDSLTIAGSGGTVFSDDAETLKADWTNHYWTRAKGAFRYQ